MFQITNQDTMGINIFSPTEETAPNMAPVDPATQLSTRLFFDPRHECSLHGGEASAHET